jgi:hypothetical protein
MKQFITVICILFSPFALAVYFNEKKVNFYGYLYLNATHAGFQGERYLLNQQLSSIQLGLDWEMVRWSKLHAVFVYNPWPNPLYPTFYFDELYNQFSWQEFWYSKIGRQWVPFGNYRSDLIYKPLAKALGQTNEDAILFGYDRQLLYANISIFSPHTPINNSLSPLFYNLNTGFKNDSYDIGISYLHSIAETQLFRYNKGFGGFMGEKIKSHVPGIASYINYNFKKVNINLSFVSALKKFNPEDLSFNHQGAKPAAISLQSGYQFNIQYLPAKIMSFIDLSSESLGLEIPEKRAGLGLNLYPYKYLDLQFQWFKDYAYSDDSIATGLNKTVHSNAKVYNTFALQVLLHF